MSKISNIPVFKVRLRQLLSDSCSAERNSMQHVVSAGLVAELSVETFCDMGDGFRENRKRKLARTRKAAKKVYGS